MEEITITITDLSPTGRGVGTNAEGKIVFVDQALPGQTVQARITRSQKRYDEARLLEVVTLSPDEIPSSYQSTAGAPWLHLPLSLQHTYKRQQIQRLFKNFANILLPEDLPLLSSPREFAYRNKMEYSFGNDDQGNFALGLKPRGKWWEVNALQQGTGLFLSEFEALLPEFSDFAKNTGLPAYNPQTQEGFWKQLMVRYSFSSDKFLLNLTTTPRSDFAISSVLDWWQDRLGERLQGFCWSQTDSQADRPTPQQTNRQWLTPQKTLRENLLGQEFELSLDSFFQPNPSAAERLYQQVLDFCPVAIKESEIILDLYCGTGTMTQLIAKKFEKSTVIGVEIVPDAIQDAQRSARRHRITNIEWNIADMRRWLKSFLATDVRTPHTIVIDPPRAGIVPKALKRIIEANAQQIIYVSCNPATMARDAKIITSAEYELDKITLVDQFPHTAHVEVVGLFSRKPTKTSI